MADSSTALDLRDIPDASTFLPSPPPPWWIWVLLGVTLLFLAWLLFRKKNSSSASSPNEAYQNACSALDQASPIAAPIALATTVSLIIRRYLAAALADPSLFETHEEFLARHSALHLLPDDLRSEISQHFSAIARLKYAPRSDAGNPSTLIADTRQLLDRLHALPSAPPASNPAR